MNIKHAVLAGALGGILICWFGVILVFITSNTVNNNIKQSCEKDGIAKIYDTFYKCEKYRVKDETKNTE